MVSRSQLRNGIARYIDTEILTKITGWKRWVIGAGATAYLSKTDDIIERLRSMEAVKLLGLFSDDGMYIDADMLYNCIRAEAEKTTATVDIPVIGSVTFSASDVDKLFDYMRM